MYHCMRLQVKQARLDSALELCGVVLTFFDMTCYLASISQPAWGLKTNINCKILLAFCLSTNGQKLMF